MRLLDLYLASKEQQKLDEANLKNLYTKSVNETPKMAKRGKDLVSRVRYFGLSEDGTLNFKVSSQSVPGRYYYAYIEAPDILRFGDIVEEGDHFTVADLARLLTMKGFRIYCSDPSFLYWAFQYISTQGNYEIQPETRAPKRNNTTLSGALCKHLIAVVDNLYNNKKMREQISTDIDNYLRMLAGMDYEDYQQLNHARQIKQQNRAVKWKDNTSDYMNDYFARQAKHHPFLDDHDIKKSLRNEITKFAHANPDGSVDDFLRSYFNMTEKAFAEDMQLPEDSVEEYFDELGLTKKQERQKERNAAKEQSVNTEQVETKDDSSIVDNTGIIQKDSEQPKKYNLKYNSVKAGGRTPSFKVGDQQYFDESYLFAKDVTSKELSSNEVKFVTYGDDGKHENVFNNLTELFKYVDQCGGFRSFKGIMWSIVSEYKGSEFYYVRDSFAKGGWKWEDANGDPVEYEYSKRYRDALGESKGDAKKLTESDEVKEYLTPKEAHQKYQEYLEGHIGNVQDAMNLIIKISPNDEFIQDNKEALLNIAKEHDKSKYSEEEYIPYLHHFYPTNEQEEHMSEEFELACKHHILHNKHHWDFWIDPSTLELPDIKEDDRQYKLYCIERVCDWLAMARQHDEEKDEWYEANKDSIKMPDWAKDYTEELYSRIPDDYYLNLRYGGTRGKLDESQDNAKFSDNIDRSDVYVHTDKGFRTRFPSLGIGYYLFNVNHVASEINQPVENGNNKYYIISNANNLLIFNSIDDSSSLLPKDLLEDAKSHVGTVADKLSIGSFLRILSSNLGSDNIKFMIEHKVDGIQILEDANLYSEPVTNETIIYNMSILKEVKPID